MPAITNDDFMMSEDQLRDIIKRGAADSEILSRTRSILNTCLSLTPSGHEGVVLRDHIKKANGFLSKYGGALGNGFVVENIGKKFLEYAEEIYSCDPEIMIARIKTEKEVIDQFVSVFETCVETYRNMGDTSKLIPLYKYATEICEITGFSIL